MQVSLGFDRSTLSHAWRFADATLDDGTWVGDTLEADIHACPNDRQVSLQRDHAVPPASSAVVSDRPTVRSRVLLFGTEQIPSDESDAQRGQSSSLVAIDEDRSFKPRFPFEVRQVSAISSSGASRSGLIPGRERVPEPGPYRTVPT